MSKKVKSAAITIAAQNSGSIAARFSAVEAKASRIHAEQTGAKIVHALLGENGLHAVLSDGKAMIEVCDGQVALRAAQ